ncbi:hypothetical protein QFC21_003002 [Naganishia friedmannii]|uniref:Uncharacterized protein n=1 Tax=Naganishia friedmannii TaxID=89922 RepID=A0ACC2VUY5_9TREE|nr:hypothetical protein QFC21_003002 [Naganishia friedmannii]
MTFLDSFKHRAVAATSEEVVYLPTALQTTLESLEPLPRTKAAARRIDPLNRLETELFTLQPFIDLYRNAYSRWAVNPPQLSTFLSQTQLMHVRLEAEKQAVRLSCNTDIQETREVALRQLSRLFDKTLTSERTMRQTGATVVPSANRDATLNQRPCGWLREAPKYSTFDGMNGSHLLKSCLSTVSTALSMQRVPDKIPLAGQADFHPFLPPFDMSLETEALQTTTIRWT